ncbi:hypothetical protein D5F11_012755 [Siminovitchia terrae]|uniref:Uncharacterized protein n=1 Tax=Siminovitchia terrae TaxID=1914933 RepID=A0A429X7B1_SIMTE|nr:hypothetical protein D5F11_012755 [Siminovitchia terrae]
MKSFLRTDILLYIRKIHFETIVIGDITGIGKQANLGKKTNQKFHSFLFKKLIQMMIYIRCMKMLDACSNIWTHSLWYRRNFIHHQMKIICPSFQRQ